VAERLYAMTVKIPRRPASDGDIRALAAAGMTIGFHTLDHAVLPALEPRELHAALTRGRSAIEGVTRMPVELIAYPYGRADTRVAHATAAAGYRAAFVTGGNAVAANANRFLLPRWEPGPLRPSRLMAEALLRLHAPSPRRPPGESA
jgi:peptidoglycan/xylan/chitin deacetylase (PgdA/CDA1 family)